MDKYIEPQVYVVNNHEVAEALRANYHVEEGNLGVIKHANFRGRENCRYVRYDFNIAENLHEYKVCIIDLQHGGTVATCDEDEEPKGSKMMFEIEYPKTYMNPTPWVMQYIKDRFSDQGIKIIFATNDYQEEYSIVDVVGRGQYIENSQGETGVYETIGARTIDKKGKKFQCDSHKLAQCIGRYTEGYATCFVLPTVWSKKENGYVTDDNYISLLSNTSGECISYIAYRNNVGYELVLPECTNKEELVKELLENILPELIPGILPESKKFAWLNRIEYQPIEMLKYKEEREHLQKEYEERILIIEEEEKKALEKNKFLRDLLTESGNELVQAVKTYFEWLGYSNVKIMDGEEDSLREDIQIDDGDKLYILEVKGIGGTSTDSECAQIAKHRRRREKEFLSKQIIPIYIVNHQRYIEPSQREHVPFSHDQIEYAENDERGLLTTFQLFQHYKYINEGIFTKKETRNALSDQYGQISLIPNTLKVLGTVKEYYAKPNAAIINMSGSMIKCGDKVWTRKDDAWKIATVISIQVDGKDVEEATDGEIGIVLDNKMSVGTEMLVSSVIKTHN